MKLTAIVLTKNEEENIPKVIDSLYFAEEILVLDDGSADDTVELAKKAGAKVIERKMSNGFASQRNFAQSQASFDWVLFIDADEEPSKELAQELYGVLANPQYGAYYIPRRDIWWGKKLQHGEVRSVYAKGIVRLVRKNAGRWEGMVHETFQANGPIGRLKGHINHYPHPDLKDFLRTVNFYSSLRAQELYRSGKKAQIFSIVFLPFAKFIYTYFIRAGFLDGSAGFTYSFLMSFHSFLVRAKLYQYHNLKPSS